MFGALGRVRAAALPTARKMGGVRWGSGRGHAEYPAEVKVRPRAILLARPQLFSVARRPPHLSPLTLRRRRWAAG